MFSKILIANRGEIAIRIAQTCREMGISTIGIYSAVDEKALHVRHMNEAYCVGPASASDSYLNMAAILDVARTHEAGAIHPGYGFLAENPKFAQAVVDAGITWIGPPPDVIACLGDKIAAKKMAKSAGVPTVPGYYGEDQSATRLWTEAETIGFPGIIKAAAGGGGKGMRIVENGDDLATNLDGAKREAQAAFGSNRVFLEKYLPRPRHIEIQIMVDAYGTAVHLAERECTLQRRHQKVIEESPSPVMTDALRTAMGESAVRFARMGGYVNAGTVEFLFADDAYYFLEMNTRIQVEHPVTEMITGLDLVQMQIEIAAGLPLTITQADVGINGHAIEARLYAEDPQNGFLPSIGTVRTFRLPLGPGIRHDVGISAGSEVSQYYDPMLGKLVVHASTRERAIVRLLDALTRYEVAGTTTNLEFLHWAASHEEFKRGRIDTGFLGREWHPERNQDLPIEVALAAAACDILTAYSPAEGAAPNPWASRAGWRIGRTRRVFSYEWNGRDVRVEAVALPSGMWYLASGDESGDYQLDRLDSNEYRLVLGDSPQVFTVVADDQVVEVSRRARAYRLERPMLLSGAGTTRRATQGEARLTSPMPGTIIKIEVEIGQVVEARQALVVLEAMKMEQVVQAPHAGVVRKIYVETGNLVRAGEPIVEIAPE
jgi:3-methylcrotonyl-CoA carboxylase alpha subunit